MAVAFASALRWNGKSDRVRRCPRVRFKAASMNESPSIKSDYRPFLDQVRWIAALIVAIGHALAILNNHANGSQTINYIADMRGPAVCIFFVLSGYLVGGLVLRDFERFRLSSYFVA